MNFVKIQLFETNVFEKKQGTFRKLIQCTIRATTESLTASGKSQLSQDCLFDNIRDAFKFHWLMPPRISTINAKGVPEFYPPHWQWLPSRQRHRISPNSHASRHWRQLAIAYAAQTTKIEKKTNLENRIPRSSRGHGTLQVTSYANSCYTSSCYNEPGLWSAKQGGLFLSNNSVFRLRACLILNSRKWTPRPVLPPSSTPRHTDVLSDGGVVSAKPHLLNAPDLSLYAKIRRGKQTWLRRNRVRRAESNQWRKWYARLFWKLPVNCSKFNFWNCTANWKFMEFSF